MADSQNNVTTLDLAKTVRADAERLNAERADPAANPFLALGMEPVREIPTYQDAFMFGVLVARTARDLAWEARDRTAYDDLGSAIDTLHRAPAYHGHQHGEPRPSESPELPAYESLPFPLPCHAGQSRYWEFVNEVVPAPLAVVARLNAARRERGEA